MLTTTNMVSYTTITITTTTTTVTNLHVTHTPAPITETVAVTAAVVEVVREARKQRRALQMNRLKLISLFLKKPKKLRVQEKLVKQLLDRTVVVMEELVEVLRLELVVAVLLEVVAEVDAEAV